MKKETLVISAFPGCGKTQFFKEQTDSEIILDSDSSKFDKSEFPENYIKHIKQNLDSVDIIFVSSHDTVREALVKEEIEYILVYPDRSLKDEYIERYKKRGNLEGFINLLEKNWDTWIDELENQKGCAHKILKSDEYISDVFFHHYELGFNISKPDYILKFHNIDNNNQELGKLFLNDDGKLEFEGDVHESAKIFFDEITKMYNEDN